MVGETPGPTSGVSFGDDVGFPRSYGYEFHYRWRLLYPATRVLAPHRATSLGNKKSMTLGKRTIVPMLALALLAVGCGDDCVSVCEDTNDCASTDIKIDDCNKFCEDGRQLAEKVDCESQFDASWGCRADQDDVCKAAPQACDKEIAALEKCLAQ